MASTVKNGIACLRKGNRRRRHSRQYSDGRGQVWGRCIEKLVFNVAYEKIGVAGSHFGAHGHAINLFITTASE